MTFEDLRCIITIAEFGSITKASKSLYISQPTLSQRLSKVENELNTKLFERNRFGTLSPTESGRIFLEEGSAILTHLNSLKSRISNNQPKRTYSIGIPVRYGHNRVRGLMEALANEHPEIVISFTDNKNYRLEQMVAQGEIDMAIVAMASPNTGYTIENIYTPSTVVRLRKDSPLRKKAYQKVGEPVPYLNLSDLRDEPVCSTPNPKEYRTRYLCELVLRQVPGFQFDKIISLPNVNMCEEYAELGKASYIGGEDNFANMKDCCLLEVSDFCKYSCDLIIGQKTNKDDALIIANILKVLHANKTSN